MELCGGVDVDPSRPDDYRTVFSASGSVVLSDLPDRPCEEPEEEGEGEGEERITSWKKGGDDSTGGRLKHKLKCKCGGGKEEDEDGSVDYCHHCEKGGDLVCCDRCPRSYHTGCVPRRVRAALEESQSESQSQSQSDEWICHLCKRDCHPDPLPDDEVTGDGSVDLIAAATAAESYCRDFTSKLTALARMHKMLTFLCGWDFGYIFREPVDPVAIPDYHRIVSRPMDLGTICSSLVNGRYCERARSDMEAEADIARGEAEAEGRALPEPSERAASERVFDEVTLAVLKDAETVWHNCFLYNAEGSAVYRMAEVQRRKMARIMERSINDLVSDDVRRRLGEFVLEKRRERARAAQARSGGRPRPPPSAKRGSDCGGKGGGDTRSRNRIRVPRAPPGVGRAVAVLDPRTGRIVKQYGSVAGARRAAALLAGLGHGDGPDAQAGGGDRRTVDALVRRGRDDHSLTMFGYRWVYADDLRRGEVAFPAEPTSASAQGAGTEGGKGSVSTVKSKAGGGSARPVGAGPGPEEVPYFLERSDPDGIRTMYSSIEVALTYVDAADKRRFAPRTFRTELDRAAMGVPIEAYGAAWRRVRRANEGSEEGGGAGPGPRHSTGKRARARHWLPPEVEAEAAGDDMCRSAALPPPLADRDESSPRPFSLEPDGFFAPDDLGPTVPPDVIIVKEDLVTGRISGGFENLDSAFRDWKRTRRAAAYDCPDPYDVDVFVAEFVRGDRNVDGIRWRPRPGCGLTDAAPAAAAAAEANANANAMALDLKGEVAVVPKGGFTADRGTSVAVVASDRFSSDDEGNVHTAASTQIVGDPACTAPTGPSECPGPSCKQRPTAARANGSATGRPPRSDGGTVLDESTAGDEDEIDAGAGASTSLIGQRNGATPTTAPQTSRAENNNGAERPSARQPAPVGLPRTKAGPGSSSTIDAIPSSSRLPRCGGGTKRPPEATRGGNGARETHFAGGGNGARETHFAGGGSGGRRRGVRRGTPASAEDRDATIGGGAVAMLSPPAANMIAPIQNSGG